MMSINNFLPKKSKIRIAVAIPSSILENCQDLRSKTEKLGIIARACAIFKVEKIFIYPHYFKSKNSIKKNNLKFITSILNYLECPPYLRKRIFSISPFLKFSGLLPPLRIAHHNLKNKLENLKSEELREGVVVKSNDKFSKIDIGLRQLYQLNIPSLNLNERITVLLKKHNSKIILSKVDSNNLEFYWGYKVSVNDIKKILEKYKEFCIILTSKYGKNIDECYKNIIGEILQSSKLIIIFGAPFEGLHSIFEKKRIEISKYQVFNLNMIPNQGTKTVTTEESIFCSLSIFNFLL